MQHTSLLYKSLVVGVIVLFIGVGVQPAFAVTSITSDSDDECNLCPKLSKQHIVRVKSLLDRLEKYDNELSVLSKLNPEIEEKYQEISNYINSDKPISIRPLCIFLELQIYWFTEMGIGFLEQIIWSWYPGEKLSCIISAIVSFSIALMFLLLSIGILCWNII
jgi:hypothetical protein